MVLVGITAMPGSRSDLDRVLIVFPFVSEERSINPVIGTSKMSCIQRREREKNKPLQRTVFLCAEGAGVRSDCDHHDAS